MGDQIEPCSGGKRWSWEGRMGGALKLGRAARRMLASASACGSFSRRKPHSISDLSAPSLSKQKSAFQEDEEIEVANPTEFIANKVALSNKDICAICLDSLNYKSKGHTPGQAIFTAQCSHAFHFTCIASNVSHGSVTCPICRAQWTQLPRNLNPPSCSQTDPIFQILDDSIANLRTHRRSVLLSAHYDDDDPVELDMASSHCRLLLSLMPILGSATHRFHSPGRSSRCMPTVTCPNYATPHPFNCSSSSFLQSAGGLTPHMACNFSKRRAYLSVKLTSRKATDLVLVALPNGQHLRLVKQAMAMVVSSLRSVDRLAIITYYSSAAARVFPLKRMTSYGKQGALQVIDRLFYTGHADPIEGLKKARKILEDRSHKNPHFSILHLSDCPSRSYHSINMEMPIPVHQFYIGFGFGSSNGFVMHEFQEFIARLLGEVIRDIQLGIGEETGMMFNIGELRGDEEKQIIIDMNESGHVSVTYSYVESDVDERITSGETLIRLMGEPLPDWAVEAGNGREIGCRVESLDYHGPFMARRWAKHLHNYRS